MQLSQFFKENPKVALAFSGGVDSAYLLYAARLYGADVTAYYAASQFQPQFEKDDARRLAHELEVPIKELQIDVLKHDKIISNKADRCYHCKKTLFTEVIGAASQDGYPILIDGTNASDSEDDRPGMRAIRELFVRSPLRECGLTKSEIRKLSKEVGLFTWNKPAYACLATRISTGEEISLDKLQAVEESENFLFSLGFHDFRVRVMGNIAKLQFQENDLQRLINKRQSIVNELKKYFQDVLLDLEVRDEN
ncbi:MAG: ATP-dependent sacrificial sulfur transferase LarE [Clostridiaceae bacterium]|nr:ATP-dependent sacrificial sulfur transferase LarE [Clostridiaceae bacterium]